MPLQGNGMAAISKRSQVENTVFDGCKNAKIANIHFDQ